MIRAKTPIIDIGEHYLKQSYRNRCYVFSPNGVQNLSIPIIKKKGKCAVKDFRIDYTENWQKNHWASISTAYNSSPFFQYLQYDFLPFYEQKWDFLADYNIALLEEVYRFLEFSPNWDISSQFIENIDDDIREIIHPKKEDFYAIKKPYKQVFDEKYGFHQNLSIFDLIFNLGNETYSYLVQQ